MRATFDPEADAAYFTIAASIPPGAAVEQVIVTRENGDVLLDFAADGTLLGVEVLQARALLSAETLAGLHQP